MSSPVSPPVAAVAAAAIESKGWWAAHRFLLARRVTQLATVLLFLAGPLAGWWIIKGNLSASRLLDTVPLSDPFVMAQVLASGHLPAASALTGLALVVMFYMLVGGRVFCSWVCPMNLATDTAAWLRRRLKISSGRAPDKAMRDWLLIAILVGCAITGTTLWEWVNPVSLAHRSLIFGGALGLIALTAVLLYDLLVSPRGWCGHLCPQGAAYRLIGRFSVTRVSAQHSSRCNDCGDCYAVCPEPKVIPMALKGKDGAKPVIQDAACTNCGRCIDVCSTDVFRFTHRWDNRRV